MCCTLRASQVAAKAEWPVGNGFMIPSAWLAKLHILNVKTLETHFNRHSGEKLTECNQCDYTIPQSSDLGDV